MAIAGDHIRVYVKGGGYVSFPNDPKVEEQLNHLIQEEQPEYQGLDYFGDLVTVDAECVVFISRRLAANAAGRGSGGAASFDAV